MTELNKLGRLTYLLIVFDAILCAAIIYKVPYTEIDWTAYMQQVAQFNAGERDYALIKGQTGPLVYPAGHVYVYSGLYWITNHGRDILTGQIIFCGLYLGTLATTLANYRRANAPLYVLLLLVLSKRLHSIYMLRLFNDGISAFLMASSVYWYSRRIFIAGTLFYSLALSVKMNALLMLPAVGFVLVQGLGVGKAIRHATIILQLQLLIGAPFLIGNAQSYLTNAFDFSRVFLYKWTVNWRFVAEDVFLSREFATALLIGHVSVLLLFATQRWVRPTGVPITRLIRLTISMTLGALFPTGDDIEPAHLTPDYVLTTMYSCNLIGVLFARSLHYQFYAWFAWGMPYLLYKTRLFVPIQIALWVAQEWAWNVFPSTPISSAVAVAVPAITLTALFLATKHDVVAIEPVVESRRKH